MKKGKGYKGNKTSMFYYVAVLAGNLSTTADHSLYFINYIYSLHLRCRSILFEKHHSFYQNISIHQNNSF